MPVQLNASLEIFIQIKEDRPPVQAPYKADAKQTVAILKKSLDTGAYRGRSLKCIQLQPAQIMNDVRMKNKLAAISSGTE
jgi:hypothetical protein